MTQHTECTHPAVPSSSSISRRGTEEMEEARHRIASPSLPELNTNWSWKGLYATLHTLRGGTGA